MNGAYWHIATNHIPVVATPFIAVLLGWGLYRKSQEVVKVAYVAAVAVALVTIFVLKTGESAERVAHEIPGIQMETIHKHEEAADFGFWAAEIVGALSLIGLWLGRRGAFSTRWGIFVLVVALWASVVEARVAHLGGLIRHPEIQAGPANSEIKDG